MSKPTDSYLPDNLHRVIIRSWIHGNLELHILKFDPYGQNTFLFHIIGRADPSHEYSRNGKPAQSFIDTNERFEELILKTKKRFNIKD